MAYDRNYLPSDAVYPLVYGNEEETGLLDNFCGQMEEPYQLAEDLEFFIPKGLQFAAAGWLIYLQNGAKIYAGGAGGITEPTNIERATPECRTPAQLATYIRAGELLLIDTVQHFLNVNSQDSTRPLTARIQRRVVDSAGSRKGCHDNFGVDEHSILGKATDLPEQMLAHLATRSFVTGAGYAHQYGPQYAQKIGGLELVRGYGYVGTMYRMAPTEGTPRIEVRCNDINISDWATRVRLGSTAIAIALNQTPLRNKLPGISEHDALIQARQMNVMELNKNGTITKTNELESAVAFQQAQAELLLTDLEKYTDELPSSLSRVAREVIGYCEDFTSVMNNEATIAILADRADWAAKFLGILDRLQADEANGINRDLYDVQAQAGDLQYDYMRLTASSGRPGRVVQGLGYRLRDRGRFRGHTTTVDDLNLAYLQPPRDTRAALRVKLIAYSEVVNCDWHLVTLENEGARETFRFADVRQTELSEYDQNRLKQFKIR